MDLATRVLAGNIKANGRTCAGYFVTIGKTQEQADTYCNGVDLTDFNTLKLWINATWYNADG